MATFGIDLGTTYSCIARVDDSGRASVIKNALGEDLTPSVVYFESPDSVVVGQDAKSVAKLYPERWSLSSSVRWAPITRRPSTGWHTLPRRYPR